jgi:hypothetical protein
MLDPHLLTIRTASRFDSSVCCIGSTEYSCRVSIARHEVGGKSGLSFGLRVLRYSTFGTNFGERNGSSSNQNGEANGSVSGAGGNKELIYGASAKPHVEKLPSPAPAPLIS